MIRTTGDPEPQPEQLAEPIDRDFERALRSLDSATFYDLLSQADTKEAFRVLVAKLAARRADLVVSREGADADQCPSFLIEAKRWTGYGRLDLQPRDSGRTQFLAESRDYCAALVAAYEGQSERAHPCPLSSQAPGAAEADTVAGTHDHWRVLPSFSTLPLTRTTCRTAAAVTPMTKSATGQLENDPADDYSHFPRGRLRVGTASVVSRFLVTIQDKQAARDYRAGLLRLIDGILSALHLMQVVLLAALAHQPQAISCVLVMLSSIRHYGHRGEPDAWPLSDFSLKPEQQWGAACPVT
jgi:hypothetical protein